MRRSSSAARSPSQPQHILNYSIASDIQFNSRSGTSNITMNGNGNISGNNCSPFLLHSQQQQHQYLSYPLFEGPFQIIEPGSDMYIEMDSDYGMDPFEDSSGVMEQQELFISENGIPQDVLEDVFQLDDDIETAGGTLPKQYPVAAGLSMAQYEQELVAEMEKMFPEPPADVSKSRLMEELVKTDFNEYPYYMNVQLKTGDGSRKGHEIQTTSRDAQKGFRCVEISDANGTSFKASYYHHQAIEKQPKSFPPAKNALQQRRVAELLQSTPLRNLSPAMASKIESLASGNRNVTLTPVRCSSTPPPANVANSRNTALMPSSTTIFIKTPKKTIISTPATSTESPTPPPPLAVDFPFPMVKVKQEPPDEAEQAVISAIEVPIIGPTSTVAKQPRKQKLQSLSQCDVVFKEGTCPGTTVGGNRGQLTTRKLVPRPPRGPPPNDFVTVTIKDANNNDNSKNSKDQASIARPATSSIPPASNKARPPASSSYPFRKRSLVTHYRVQMAPNQKRIPGQPGQPVESIEILDSSEEERDETKESSSGTTTAAESEAEDARKLKLPGNNESINCPFCGKAFFSSHSLMLHSQNCADSVLFGQTSSPKSQPPPGNKRSSKKGESIPKSSTDKGKKLATTEVGQKKPECKDQQPATESRRKRSPVPRSSMRLSIEILPTAFSIENLLLCNVCKKTFRTQEHLDVHQKIHRTPTVCNYCKKKFYELPRKHICQEMKRSKQQK